MRATAQRDVVRLLLGAAALLLPAHSVLAVDPGPAPVPVSFLPAATARARLSRALDAAPARLWTSPRLRTFVARTKPAASAARTGRSGVPSGQALQRTAQPLGLEPEDRSIVIVREGQTPSDIAKAHGIPLKVLLEVNDLRPVDRVRAGEVLLLPPMGGGPDMIVLWTTPVGQSPDGPPRTAQPAGSAEPLVVAVAEGQTLWAIAQQYNVTVEDLVEANALPSAEMISVGQRIVVPGRTAAALRPDASRVRVPRATIAQGFLWPSRGVLRSRFGWRYVSRHNGIDISAPLGTSIDAAMAGRVRFAGWYGGYGKTVIIDHGNGVTTLYGHASQLTVHAGQRVEAGQLIARVGSTGRSTGPHLHFEIRVNGRPLDPLKYL